MRNAAPFGSETAIADRVYTPCAKGTDPADEECPTDMPSLSRECDVVRAKQVWINVIGTQPELVPLKPVAGINPFTKEHSNSRTRSGPSPS